jgi:hypothetical protein
MLPVLLMSVHKRLRLTVNFQQPRDKCRGASFDRQTHEIKAHSTVLWTKRPVRVTVTIKSEKHDQFTNSFQVLSPQNTGRCRRPGRGAPRTPPRGGPTPAGGGARRPHRGGWPPPGRSFRKSRPRGQPAPPFCGKPVSQHRILALFLAKNRYAHGKEVYA